MRRSSVVLIEGSDGSQLTCNQRGKQVQIRQGVPSKKRAAGAHRSLQSGGKGKPQAARARREGAAKIDASATVVEGRGHTSAQCPSLNEHCEDARGDHGEQEKEGEEDAAEEPEAEHTDMGGIFIMGATWLKARC